ncbi:MAG: hypothetical protein ABL925_20140 [Methylococcales bacterium]
MYKNFLVNKHNLFTLLLVLALMGVAITKYYPTVSHYFWFLMMFVFGMLSIAGQYFDLQHSLREQKAALIQQGLHWLGGLFVAVIVNAYYHSGRIFTEETGLIMLLTLALTTYLEGSQRGWRYCFIGVFLGVLAVAAAYFDDYLWQLGLLALIGMAFSHSTKPANALTRSLV